MNFRMYFFEGVWNIPQMKICTVLILWVEWVKLCKVTEVKKTRIQYETAGDWPRDNSEKWRKFHTKSRKILIWHSWCHKILLQPPFSAMEWCNWAPAENSEYRMENIYQEVSSKKNVKYAVDSRIKLHHNYRQINQQQITAVMRFRRTRLDLADPSLKQQDVKIYNGSFVRLVVKAVHIESVEYLTKEALRINHKKSAKRRLLDKGKKILSDNGWNFIGAREVMNVQKMFAKEGNESVDPFVAGLQRAKTSHSSANFRRALGSYYKKHESPSMTKKWIAQPVSWRIKY